MDELGTNRAFLQVVRSGNFSAASVEMGVSVATVARQVNALEDRLNVRLFHRTTRAISLTEAGELYHRRISGLLADLDALKADVASHQTDVKGVLRVHLRRSVGNQVIVPALSGFLDQHPDLTLDLTLTDSRDDLVAKGVDVAVWLGSLEDSNLVARKLCPGHRVVCCSPAYAERRGLPTSPADLGGHNCIVYKASRYDRSWRFSRDGRTQSIEVSGNVETTSSAALLTCALQGTGLVLLQETMTRTALREGRLLNVFPEYHVSSTADDVGLFVVFPAGRRTPPKARAFIEFLVDLFRENRAAAPAL